MDASASFRSKGLEFSKAAQQQLDRGDRQAALRSFSQAVSYFQTCLKYEKNATIVGIVRGKLEQCQEAVSLLEGKEKLTTKTPGSTVPCNTTAQTPCSTIPCNTTSPSVVTSPQQAADNCFGNEQKLSHFLKQAVYIVNNAIRLDQAGNLREAISQYGLAVHTYLKAVDGVSDENVKNVVRSQVQQYRFRAQELEQLWVLQQREGQPPQPSQQPFQQPSQNPPTEPSQQPPEDHPQAPPQKPLQTAPEQPPQQKMELSQHVEDCLPCQDQSHEDEGIDSPQQSILPEATASVALSTIEEKELEELLGEQSKEANEVTASTCRATEALEQRISHGLSALSVSDKDLVAELEELERDMK